MLVILLSALVIGCSAEFSPFLLPASLNASFSGSNITGTWYTQWYWKPRTDNAYTCWKTVFGKSAQYMITIATDPSGKRTSLHSAVAFRYEHKNIFTGKTVVGALRFYTVMALIKKKSVIYGSAFEDQPNSYYIQTAKVKPSQKVINEINKQLQALELQAPNLNLTSVSDFYKNCNDTKEYNAEGVPMKKL